MTKNGVGQLFRVSLSISILMAIIFVCVIIIFVYFVYPTFQDDLKFNNLDDMAIALQENYADEEVLYLSLSPIVKFWCLKLVPYFRELRLKKADDTIYTHIEKLYNEWNKR